MNEDDRRRTDAAQEQHFLRLFLEEERRLRRFVLAQVPNWSEADDILQETLTVIWEKFGEFQPGTDFLAWALRIARYQVLSFRKKQQKARARFSDQTVEALAEGMSGMMNDQADVRHEALQGCVDKLSARDRELIHLRYQPGATTRQVAEDLGRSLVAVYKALNRIHEQLLLCIRRTLETETR